jgi:hypothetical protein
MLAGCKREEIVLSVDNVKTNTVLVNKDGTVRAATVETFDKNYYSLSELKDFVTEKIKKYNSEAGAEAVLLDSLEIKDGNAVMILKYTSLDHYNQFNKVEAVLAKVTEIQNADVTLPDTFINVKNGAEVSKDIALENEKYKVLVMNENTNIMVEGTIKYYSNVVLVNSTTAEASQDGTSVIIFK